MFIIVVVVGYIDVIDVGVVLINEDGFLVVVEICFVCQVEVGRSDCCDGVWCDIWFIVDCFEYLNGLYIIGLYWLCIVLGYDVDFYVFFVGGLQQYVIELFVWGQQCVLVDLLVCNVDFVVGVFYFLDEVGKIGFVCYEGMQIVVILFGCIDVIVVDLEIVGDGGFEGFICFGNDVGVFVGLIQFYGGYDLFFELFEQGCVLDFVGFFLGQVQGVGIEFMVGDLGVVVVIVYGIECVYVFLYVVL